MYFNAVNAGPVIWAMARVNMDREITIRCEGGKLLYRMSVLVHGIVGTIVWGSRHASVVMFKTPFQNLCRRRLVVKTCLLQTLIERLHLCATIVWQDVAIALKP